jgi:MFS transporter, DHA1 family, tetracycline resistance protein
LGPAMAAWLGGPDRLHVPFVVAACLSAGSMVLSWVLLESGVPKAQGPADAAAAPGGKRPGVFDMTTYLEYFRRPVLGSLYLQFFCFAFAFSAFMSGFALFARPRLGWTAREVGYLFAYSGVLGIILQGGVLERLVKRFGEPRLVVTGFIAVVIAYVTLGFAVTVSILVVAATISTFGNGVLRPVVTSQITQHVGRHEQGLALGISGSLNSLALTIAPPIGGYLLDHNLLVGWTLVPAIAAAVGLIAALRRRPAAAAPTVAAGPAESTISS